jgi:hypothetical protein
VTWQALNNINHEGEMISSIQPLSVYVIGSRDPHEIISRGFVAVMYFVAIMDMNEL